MCLDVTLLNLLTCAGVPLQYQNPGTLDKGMHGQPLRFISVSEPRYTLNQGTDCLSVSYQSLAKPAKNPSTTLFLKRLTLTILQEYK